MSYSSRRIYEDLPRAVISTGNEYSASFELAVHQHRKSQLIYAAKGVVTVSTPVGAWVAPPAQAVWIPGGTPHSVRMVGAVITRGVLIDQAACSLGNTCRVISVGPLLRALLVAATDIVPAYDEASRDGLVMSLLIAELQRAPVIPLAVPFPRHSALAAHCQRFIERPDAGATIDAWAESLAMNRKRFTRLFRRETGMSFSQWRQQACISAALPRLAEGREQITKIALDLGYQSAAAFTAMFKRVLGIAPSLHQKSVG